MDPTKVAMLTSSINDACVNGQAFDNSTIPTIVPGKGLFPWGCRDHSDTQ
jgi:hypothetical protein